MNHTAEAQRTQARARFDLLANRRRVSLEELSRAFVASGASPRTPRAFVEAARQHVAVGFVEALLIGPTFADTVALNRPFLDIFEEGGDLAPARGAY